MKPKSKANGDNFKYDIAFSFMHQDEELAYRIYNLIKDRVKAFIYSREQEKIAGTNGEIAFNKVFSKEARIVVVLYRKEWGSTAWTRIEETAIRNRAYEEGYDFAIFIPLEKTSCLPQWLPKTQLWFGLDRWGIEGAGSVIEARIQQSGGRPKSETASDTAIRMQHEIVEEADRIKFLRSHEGVEVAEQEVAKLFGEYENIAKEVNQSQAGFSLRCERGQKWIRLSNGEFILIVSWQLRYSNSLEDSILYLRIMENVFMKEQELKILEFQFDKNIAGNIGWRDTNDPSQHYSTNRLAKHSIEIFYNVIKESREGD